jgi:hypothetical protein
MTEENQQTQEAASRQPIQIKNRTVLIVLLFVIIPWVALALPGYYAAQHEIDSDNVKSATVHRKFGWPLAHKTESQTSIIGVMRGGQFRTTDKPPQEKMDKLLEAHGEWFASNGGSALNIVPKASEGQAFASLWTNMNNYPTEIRKYVQDNVLKIGLKEQWNVPMLVVNIVLLVLACLVVGYLVEKSLK